MRTTTLVGTPDPDDDRTGGRTGTDTATVLSASGPAGAVPVDARPIDAVPIDAVPVDAGPVDAVPPGTVDTVPGGVWGAVSVPAPRGPADTTPPAVVESDATHFEVDLDPDDGPDAGGVVVDLPPGTPGALSTVEGARRRPVIPVGLQGWANMRASLADVWDRAGHVCAFHAVRAPWYGLQTCWWATVGAARVAGRVLGWWWVAEQVRLRQRVAEGDDPMVWLRLHQEVRRTRLWRGLVLGAGTVTAALAGPLAWWLLPWWAKAAVVAVAAVLLAQVGRPQGRSIVAAATVTARHRRLSADVVLRAYYAAGLGHPERPGQQIGFASTMSRDAVGAGSQVVVDLPYGKGFSDVLKAKDALASGLDVSVNQVFLTRDESSHRRHLLFVSDQDPLAIPAGKTPLLDGKPRSIWTPAPLGLDERGHKVSLELMWISILVGAQPRKGKTFFARLLALYAALDASVRLTVVDGKMSSDWDKFRLVAHRMVVGKVPNSRDDDPVAHLLAALREIEEHIQAVNDLLAKLPVTECPEGKITPELGRTYPLLRPWLLVMEEFQVYYELDDQDTNKEIAGLLSYIMAVGPSAGVIIVGASQKPSGIGAGDVARLFNRFRDNFAVRFALKCGNRNVSEAVLGGDAYAEGFDASALPAGTRFRGVGILYGASDDTPITRSYLADHGDAEKILLAARRHRQAAGTLSGMAAGEDLARESRDVLADAAVMFNPGDKGLQWEELATRLAQRIPEHYAEITAETISAQLRGLRLRSVDVKRAGAARKGVRLDDITAAITARTNG